jgi:predicted unusual protein kinase regulating ubiquinone biosynthesis (AarF/ABC1/UbiB family)
VRLLIITWRLAPIAFSFWRDKSVQRTPEFHARRAQRLTAALAKLGPTFIKMAQMLGARTDVIPEPYVSSLASLMDRVPATPWPIMAEVIRRAYGKPAADVFESIAEVPLASASLGQVYEGRVDGRKVAVKVMRPGVEGLIQADCAATRQILAVAERVFRSNPRTLRAIRQFRVVLEEFAFRVRDEVDYRLEAANAVEVRENFADTPGIRVPEVLLPLVRQRVLVMEFMEGDAVDALGPRVASGELDISMLVPRLIEAYTSMMMIDGLFHADPHPKNLLIAPDGALVLLDFGMVVRVSRAMRRALLDTIMAAIRKDIDGVVAGFDALGLRAPDATRDELRPVVAFIMQSASQYATTQERMDLLADQVMVNLYDKPPISVPSTMVYFARTASLIEGLATRYDPRFNPIAVATPVMLRLQPAILVALGRTHMATPADWVATVTTVVGDGLDVVSSRIGLSRPGQLSRLGGQLARQLRSLFNGHNGGPPRLGP